jgi:hypothetical protein
MRKGKTKAAWQILKKIIIRARTKPSSHVWWHMSVIPALRKLR